MSEHSFLSPSAAHRFMCCPVAPIYEATYPDKTTPAAQEGTNAHKWAELVLQGLVSIKDVPTEYGLIEPYVAYVKLYQDKPEEYHVYLEHRLTIPEIRGFGTADALIIKPLQHEVEILDLKYGKIPVDIDNNSQLILYAIGYLNRGLYPMIGIKTIRTTICQPKRARDIFHTATYPVDEILSLRQGYKEQADKIFEMQESGQLEYTHGTHCTWCRHRNNCETFVESEYGF